MKDYDSPGKAHAGISDYLEFYNHRRLHQALDSHTSASVYFQEKRIIH